MAGRSRFTYLCVIQYIYLLYQLRVVYRLFITQYLKKMTGVKQTLNILNTVQYS